MSASTDDSDTSSTVSDTSNTSEASDTSTDYLDERIAAQELWNRYASRNTIQFAAPPPPPQSSEERPPAESTPLGIHNTAFLYHKRPVSRQLMIDSLDRDPTVFPTPTALRLQLPHIYRNIDALHISQIRFWNGIVPFAATRGNTSLLIDVDGGPTNQTITIPDGSYTAGDLLTALNTALTAAALGITATYTAAGFLQFTHPTASFTLKNLTGLAAGFSSRTSYWGLGWNLGFGGIPVDQAATPTTPVGPWTLTADALPRLVDDYIYLRLNETENMNMIDHTSPENLAVSQESTGQVAHYFAKLLLNGYASWAWRLFALPKRFQPVLGRLDRLQITLLDRFGQPLSAYTGALSCDWNATVCITELVEGPSASSAVTFSQIGGVNDDFGMDQNPPYIR